MPTPSTTIVIPDDWLRRGNTNISPSTKSQATQPNVYCVEEACGNYNFEVGSMSVSLNEMIDCRPFQQASGTLNLRIIEGATAAQINVLVDFLKEQLVSAMVANSCVGDVDPNNP